MHIFVYNKYNNLKFDLMHKSLDPDFAILTCTQTCLTFHKYRTFNTIFRQHNIHLVFSTWQHKYKWILCTEIPVKNNSFQDF